MLLAAALSAQAAAEAQSAAPQPHAAPAQKTAPAPKLPPAGGPAAPDPASVRPVAPTIQAPPARLHPGVTPSLVVHLSHPLYHIAVDPKSGEPVMPRNVVAYARLDGWPADVPQPASFTWRVMLDWDFKACPTHHSISRLKFEHPSPFPVNLAGEVRGGRLKVFAKTSFEGREVSAVAIAEVRGTNPPRSAVLRAFPPNRTGLIASKIAMAESGMRQFDPVDGLPMLSKSTDVGLMQLNAPTGGVTADDQVWDWRANVRRGLEMMADKRRITVFASRGSSGRRADLREPVLGYENAVCVAFARWYVGWPTTGPLTVPPLSKAPGSGMQPGEEDPDHVALSQEERDMIRRYNGGREFTLAILTDPSSLSVRGIEWRVDPARGGVRARAGDPDYVGHVLCAHSGFVFPKPVTAHHSRRRHRRRRRT